MANPSPDPDAAVRQDLTHMTVLAIDDASTQEVDDGVSAEVLSDGQVSGHFEAGSCCLDCTRMPRQDSGRR